MYEVENQQWQCEAETQWWQQNADTETEHSHEFGDGGINEIAAWTTVNTGRTMRPTTKRRWGNAVKTDNSFEPLNNFDDFDDDEFPPIEQTSQTIEQLSQTSQTTKVIGRRRTMRNKLKMPPMRKGTRPTKGTPAAPKETGSLGEEAATTNEKSDEDTRVGRWKGRKTKDESTPQNEDAVISAAGKETVGGDEEECQEVSPQTDPWIADIDSCVRNNSANLMEVNCSVQNWERIPLKIDSGAIDTVMPPTMAKYFPLEPTERSRNGEGYLAANNSVIPHYGMRKLKGQSDEYRPMTMIAQVAGVKSALVSVHRLLEAGNRVHFERGNCYVEHVKSKIRTNIAERNGAFEVGFWIPRTSENVKDDKGFPWQDTMG